ncbi:hypothetical protein [Achromobacter aegrifaciens]
MSKVNNAVSNDPKQVDVGQPPPAAATTQPDEHHGRGGSYLRDSATGERILMERTEPCSGCQAR